MFKKKFSSFASLESPIWPLVALVLILLLIAAILPLKKSGKAASISAYPFNYQQALQMGILWFEGNVSGPKPAWNRITWRGNSPPTPDAVQGGLYDAGDHVKFGLPMAYTASMLAWGAVEYPAGFNIAGQMDELQNNLKFITDYLIATITPSSGAVTSIVGQIGDGGADHGYWGPPETMTMPRPAYSITTSCPGSDLAGEYAAALAASSIVFRNAGNTSYADTLLTNAERVYTFAETYLGKYDACITAALGFYNSYNGYEDELSWGAYWVYKAKEAKTAGSGTSPVNYLQKSQNWYQAYYNLLGTDGEHRDYYWTGNWNDKYFYMNVLLARQTGGADPYMTQLLKNLHWWQDGYGGTKVPVSVDGLPILDAWGPTRYAANQAWINFVAADSGLLNSTPDFKATTYQSAKFWLNYILGQNSRNSSYVVGFGRNWPLNVHHRSASGWSSVGDSRPNQHINWGGLAGGPALDGTFTDSRPAYPESEVACDFNATFVIDMARMVIDYNNDPTPAPIVVATLDATQYPASWPTVGPTFTLLPPTKTPTKTLSPTPTHTSPPLQGPNLALNKTASASSIESGGLEAGKAVDGDGASRWASLFSDPQWIQIDLGSVTGIDRVRLNWEAAYGRVYKLQVSNDASTWIDVYTTSSGDGGMDDIWGLNTSGRYIRMYGTGRGTPYGYSLYEFEVYGPGTGPTNTPAPTATSTPSATPTATPSPTPTFDGSTGYKNPAANAADIGGDGNGFESSPANGYTNDNAFAKDTDSGNTTAASCSDSGKDRHRYYNYGFNLPSGAVINGIEVLVELKVDNTTGSPYTCVELSWDAGATWTAAKTTATLSKTSTQYVLGGATDTWGRSWTNTQFGDASFRVRLTNVATDNARDFSLDEIAVRVYYTQGPTPTNTSAVTSTFTPTPTPTNTRTNTPAVTNTFTATPAVTNTRTNTPVPTNTFTATPAPSNTPTATPTATATSVPSSLKVQYKCADCNATVQAIKPNLQIVNTGASAVAYSSLEIRYWYTWDGSSQTQSYTCYWAPIGCANITGAFTAVSPARTGADYYLKLTFSANAGSLAAGASSGEIQNGFNKNDWSNYTQTGDYSFDSSKTSLADWNKVTLYQNGALVWGTEP